MLWPSSEEGELVHLNLPLTYEQWDSQRKMWLSRESKVQPCHTWGWVFERKKYGEVVLIYVTTAECRGTDSDVIHWDRRRVKTFTRSPCHFWYLIPRIFPLFVLYWPIYSLLRVKILQKKKESVWAIVYFFKNGAHVNFPAERGGECFYICHSSINTPAAWRLFLPLSLPPSLSLSISLSGFLKLSLSLNVRWEEAARIIGHASVGLFDHVTRRRLHTYVPLNKPSNVAPEAEQGSEGSGGPVLCNDGKMEQFCLCWFYVCVCVCVCVWLSAATRLSRLQLGLHLLCCSRFKAVPTPKRSRTHKPTTLTPVASAEPKLKH